MYLSPVRGQSLIGPIVLHHFEMDVKEINPHIYEAMLCKRNLQSKFNENRPTLLAVAA